MTINGWVQIAIFALIVVALTKPLGGYMTRVFNGERTILSPVYYDPLSWVSTGLPASTSVRNRAG